MPKKQSTTPVEQTKKEEKSKNTPVSNQSEKPKPAPTATKSEKPKTAPAEKNDKTKNAPAEKKEPKNAPAEKKEPKNAPEEKETKPVPAAKKDEDKHAEEVDSDSSDSDEMPELMNAADAAGSDCGDLKGKRSRTERKAIKALSNLGLKQVKDIVRVTIRRSKSIVFVISPAEVYKANGGDTYVIFGDAKMEDMSAQAQLAAAEKFRSLGKEKESIATQPTIMEEDENEEVDAGSLDENDISLIMTQASCSRNKAIKTLKEVDGDIVNAIMKLTV